ncbi:transketolase family protein [Candidatus Microgenomates bacterium]|nr:transketolase family protein [Candidatus Microgenomates bacterium]
MSREPLLSQGQHLNPQLFHKGVSQVPIRQGFGEGLRLAGEQNSQVVAMSADLTESTRMNLFAEAYPERFFNVGVAEQNLATVAAGLAVMGKVPFISSYAAFSPGRNYEQIRTTIALNDVNVKIVGSHAGISVGPDGATHQMLEDIAMMRVLPNMRVVVPADAVEARKATLALASTFGPSYLRLAREKSPIITTDNTPFSLGQAAVLRIGYDLTIVACGTMVYQALQAARLLSKKKIEAEVINCAVIKPLDTATILASIRKTRAVVTAEEHQISGGLGGALAELLSENDPVPLRRIGINDRFGESGDPEVLLKYFGLDAVAIAQVGTEIIRQKSKG